MSTAPAESATGASDGEAFAFVQDLAAELSRGKVDLPSFPDVALRVRQVLADEEVSPERVVRVISAEPALAAQLLQIANSAALNASRKKVTDLRAAVTRMGFNVVRSAAIAFAMAQLHKAKELRGLEKPLRELWRRSATVAAMSYVVAKHHSKVNPDTALLAGLLHGIGQLYILTRSAKHPTLFAKPASYNAIVRDWSAPVAKALLENWGMAEEIVTAVNEFEHLEREHEGAADLVDVLTVGYLLTIYQKHPDTIELNLQNVAACKRVHMDTSAYRKLIEESNAEIEALRQALGV
jgi:HD-like signal output (HDOD) protein